MFCIDMKISFVKNNIHFKAYEERTYLDTPDSLTRRDVINHKTEFFRDYPTLKFTRDYISETFPEKADIAEFGCSQGQKCYSMMVMLEEAGYQGNYKINGYDFEKPIAKAKMGNYKVQKSAFYESLLFGKNSISDKFFGYFNILDKKNADERIISDVFFVAPNKETIGDKVKFQLGNVLDIKKLIAQKGAEVVIFQNALYHLLDDYDNPSKKVLKSVESLFKKIHGVLSTDGIFVLGNLPSDHMYSYRYEKTSHFIQQGEKKIRICKPTKIEKLLIKSGFTPVFYERIPYGTVICKYNDVHLPSVWKKINRLF